MLTKLHHYLRSIATLDLRALAFFRITLGLIALYDFLDRLQDARLHYSDSGILPRELIHYPYAINLQMLSGAVCFQQVVLAMGMGLAVAFLLGYRTKLSGLLLWLSLASVNNRAPIFVHGADIYLRALLVWALFLPVGAVFSFDSKKKRLAGEVFSIATVGIIAQIGVGYFVAGLLKLNDVWLSQQALENLMSYLFFPRQSMLVLAGFPKLLKLGTSLSLTLELFFPLLLLVPARFARIRMFGVLAMISFHLMIWLLLDVGLFSPVSIAGLLLLVPSLFWDRVFKGAPRTSVSPPQKWTKALCALFLILCLWQMVDKLRVGWIPSMPSRIENVVAPIGLDQHWGMFNRPSLPQTWPLAVAETLEGKALRLPDDKPLLTFKSRKDLEPNFATMRQKKAYVRLLRADDRAKKLRRGYARYHCHRLTAKKVVAVEIYQASYPPKLFDLSWGQDLRKSLGLRYQCADFS